MIVDFTVKNFRSFKDTSTLSLVAEPLADDGIPLSPTVCGDKILPVAGVFGQNAAGKSNILKAFIYMKNAILNSNPMMSPINEHPLLQPFLFSTDNDEEPIHFEISLWDKDTGSQYNYGFEVGDAGVVSEWLHLVQRPKKNKTPRLLFLRSHDGFIFNKTVKSYLEPLAKHVQEEALAINVFGNLAEEHSHRLLELISTKIRLIDGAKTDWQIMNRINSRYLDEKLLEKVVDFIKRADMGINNISIERMPMKVNESASDALKENTRLNTNRLALRFAKELSRFAFDPGDAYEIISEHSVYDDNGHKIKGNHKFSFGNESLGTQKIFDLAFILLQALDNGETVVFDEFGSSLHPFLTNPTFANSH